MPAPKIDFEIVAAMGRNRKGYPASFGKLDRSKRAVIVPWRLFDITKRAVDRAKSLLSPILENVTTDKVLEVYSFLFRHRDWEIRDHRREYLCNDHFFFEVHSLDLKKVGGRNYNAVLTYLEKIKAIQRRRPHRKDRERFSQQKVCLNASWFSDAWCTVQYGRAAYSKAPEIPPALKGKDVFIDEKVKGIKSLFVDRNSAIAFLESVESKSPDLSEALRLQFSLIENLSYGQIGYTISDKVGRHYTDPARVKRELRYFLKGQFGDNLVSLDIKTSLARMLYILLHAFVSSPIGGTPDGQQKERGVVPLSHLSYSLVQVRPEALQRLQKALTEEDRQGLRDELSRFRRILERSDLYSKSINWIKEDHPNNLGLPSRDDVKGLWMAYIYGKPDRDGLYPGMAFEKRFPYMGKAIRAIKNPDHEIMAQTLQRMESALVHGYLHKRFSSAGAKVAYYVHDSWFFHPEDLAKIRGITEEAFSALGLSNSVKPEIIQPPLSYSKKQPRFEFKPCMSDSDLRPYQKAWTQA